MGLVEIDPFDRSPRLGANQLGAACGKLEDAQ